jgi:hypothetical protein
MQTLIITGRVLRHLLLNILLDHMKKKKQNVSERDPAVVLVIGFFLFA